MSKKLIVICFGIAALTAMVLPTIAAASPEVTHPTGTTLAKNTKITATNTETAILTTDPTDGSEPKVLSECTKVVITGELLKNTGTEIEANITTATFSGAGEAFDNMAECKGLLGLGNLTPTTNGTDPVGTKIDGEDVANGTPWCLKSAANDKFTVRGGTCNEAARAIVFILNSTSAGECEMEKATAVEGEVRTDKTMSSEDALLTVPGDARSTFKKIRGGVLCPSAGTLDLSFTLETDTTPASPIWIS